MASLPTPSKVINAVMANFLKFVVVAAVLSVVLSPLAGVPLGALVVWGLF